MVLSTVDGKIPRVSVLSWVMDEGLIRVETWVNLVNNDIALAWLRLTKIGSVGQGMVESHGYRA
jgi:hypothetical protein